jgi:DNA-binding protein H-NS
MLKTMKNYFNVVLKINENSIKILRTKITELSVLTEWIPEDVEMINKLIESCNKKITEINVQINNTKISLEKLQKNPYPTSDGKKKRSKRRRKRSRSKRY